MLDGSPCPVRVVSSLRTSRVFIARLRNLPHSELLLPPLTTRVSVNRSFSRVSTAAISHFPYSNIRPLLPLFHLSRLLFLYTYIHALATGVPFIHSQHDNPAGTAVALFSYKNRSAPTGLSHPQSLLNHRPTAIGPLGSQSDGANKQSTYTFPSSLPLSQLPNPSLCAFLIHPPTTTTIIIILLLLLSPQSCASSIRSGCLTEEESSRCRLQLPFQN